MHDAAFQCAQERLSSLITGRFSLEPRYRYEQSTKKTTLISPEEDQILLRAGGDRLKGTLKPDVVIHTGNPIEVYEVYDFKFPCVNSTATAWPLREGGMS